MSKRPAPVHVTYRKDEDKWAIRKEGNEKASRLTETKKEAVDIAREQAQNSGAELVIHNTDGKISQKDSHGRDPSPPRG